jgi:HSP20 family protein
MKTQYLFDKHSKSKNKRENKQVTTMALNLYNRNLFNYPLFGIETDPFANVLDDPTDNLLWMPVVPSLQRTSDMNLLSASPGYEVYYTDNGKTYHISMDLPGVQATDIKVNVEQDGKVLHISGGRRVSDVSMDGAETYERITRFEERFSIGNTVDMDRTTANFANGVLTLSAPVKKDPTHKVRTIKVTTEKTW